MVRLRARAARAERISELYLGHLGR
eukprot:COSAG06_NODE_55364_length_290_cov_0.486911_1_plen_24_part_01